jgi:hypothetical protein
MATDEISSPILKNEGINQLIQDNNHDYLKDLQIQQKRKHYTTMTESSGEFNNLLLPGS